MTRSTYPMVTVITPVYNRANLIEETIHSVLSQNYQNLEYIVLDDGSKDNTLEVLKKYAGLIHIESHENMGEHRTVNKGLKASKGDYIVVLNSDDLLLPGAVEAAVKTFQENPELLVAYPGWAYINEKSHILYEESVPEYDYDTMVRLHWCMVGPGAFIHRKAFELTDFRDPSFKYVADFEYWLRLGLYGPFKKISGCFGTFRIHSASASVEMKNKVMADEHLRLMDKYFRLPGVPDNYKTGPFYREAWARTYLHAARTCEKYSLVSTLYYLKCLLSYPSLWNIVSREMLPIKRS